MTCFNHDIYPQSFSRKNFINSKLRLHYKLVEKKSKSRQKLINFLKKILRKHKNNNKFLKVPNQGRKVNKTKKKRKKKRYS